MVILHRPQRPSMCNRNFNSQKTREVAEVFSITRKTAAIKVSLITIIMSECSKITFSKQDAVTCACKIAPATINAQAHLGLFMCILESLQFKVHSWKNSAPVSRILQHAFHYAHTTHRFTHCEIFILECN